MVQLGSELPWFNLYISLAELCPLVPNCLSESLHDTVTEYTIPNDAKQHQPVFQIIYHIQIKKFNYECGWQQRTQSMNIPTLI